MRAISARSISGSQRALRWNRFKDQKFDGRVTKISPMGAEKDNVTTFEVRVSISNESRKLRALMTANAEIILEEHKKVLTIPEGAVLLCQGQVRPRSRFRIPPMKRAGGE